MHVGVLRLGFAAFWLTVAGLLVWRAHFAPGDQPDPQGLTLGAALAVALAGWNVVRWYLGRRSRPAGPENPLLRHRRRPLEPKREERPAEYNPEFDFTNPPANPERERRGEG
jgi:hypothetical protein